MIFAARVAIYTVLWFGVAGLANGAWQILAFPYWFPSGLDRLAYAFRLFALCGFAGLPVGAAGGASALLLSRRSAPRAGGADALIGLALSLLFWGGFRVQRDHVPGLFGAGGILVSLALLAAAALAAWWIPRRRGSWSGVNRAAAGATVIALAAGLAIGVARAPSGGEAGGRPNILLLVIDTLRADRLSCYGNPRPASPAIDRLAREGTLVTDAVAPTPFTQPSVASLLTGLYPASAGVVNHPNRLADEATTLAEMLRAAGYRTGFANPHPLLTPTWGFGRGWDEYRYLHKPVRFEATLLAQLLRRLDLRSSRAGYQADVVTDFAIELLDRGSGGPFFIYAHYLDPHFPYAPPRPFDRIFTRGVPPNLLDLKLEDGRRRIFNLNEAAGSIEGTVTLYDGEVAFTDREVGRLLDALETRGLAESTLVVLTADHGESFGEQGLFFAHTHYLYDPTEHVPLLFRYPPALPAGRIAGGQASLVDLAPTLLDLAGIDPPAGMEGKSIAPLLLGRETSGRAAFAENGRTILRSGEEENPRWFVAGDAGKWRMIREGDWKLIRIPTPAGPVYELYDLGEDPGETEDLANERPEIVERLRVQVEEWLKRSEAAEGQTSSADEETIEGLRSLGYVQ